MSDLVVARGRADSTPTPRPMFNGATDAVTALTVFLILLLAIPSALRLPALGGVGYPAGMFAFALGLWWCWSTIRRGPTRQPINPVKITIIAFLTALLISYAWAMRRALPAVEGRQADIGLLRIIVFASVALMCCDGVASWPRFVTLIRRFVVGGGLFGLLGLAQFVSHRSLIDWISIPGFVAGQDYGVIERNGFTRASATAIHPLEYAAGLAVIFPAALTLGLYDRGRNPVLRWGPAVVMALVLVLSGSRSGYLGLAAGIMVLAFSWSRRVILLVSSAAVAMMVLVFVTVPGMIGTIRGLFLQTGHDSSTTSRSSSYALVEEFFQRQPLFGRGFGTFLPSYRILDNGLLLLLVETGALGVGCFLALVSVCGWWAARRPRLLQGELHRQLGPAVFAGVFAGVLLTGFFDSLGFPISIGTLALAVGMCGAWGRLSRTEERGETH